MTAITIKRTITRRAHLQPSETRRTFRKLTDTYLARERATEFAIEVLFFAIIVTISAWPVLEAAGALAEFLQQAPV